MPTSARRRAHANGRTDSPRSVEESIDAVRDQIADDVLAERRRHAGDDADGVPLDGFCAMLLAGLAARRRELEAVLEPYNRDAAATNRLIAERCGLLPDAVGTTHQVVAGDPPRLRRVASEAV